MDFNLPGIIFVIKLHLFFTISAKGQLLSLFYKKVHNIFSSVFSFLSEEKAENLGKSFSLLETCFAYINFMYLESVEIRLQLNKKDIVLWLKTLAYGLNKSQYKNMIKY